jgi:hypothetical protein
MNTYLNAALGTERQQQMIADAAESRRHRRNPKVKAVRRPFRSSRVVPFLKDLAAASL